MAESAAKTIARLERGVRSLQRDVEKRKNKKSQREKDEQFDRKIAKKAVWLKKLPYILLPLAVVLYGIFQEVTWSGAIEIEDTTYHDPSHSQSYFLSQYSRGLSAEIRQERERVDSVTIEIDGLADSFQTLPGVGRDKALGLLAGYEAMTGLGWSTSQTIGLLACAMNEGAPGLIQYGYPKQDIIDTEGLGGVIHESSSRNPLVIETREQLDALIQIQPDAGAMGAGTAQWTWGRCLSYFNLYLELYPDNDTYSPEERYSIDKEMYRRELTGGYKSLSDTVAEHSDTLETNLVWSYFKYEAGFGFYKNSDKIVDYGGDFFAGLNKRYNSALQLQQLFSDITQ